MKKNEYGDLKRMLLDEYMQSNPTDDEVDAFYTGLTWFEDALYDDDIDNELNDFLPLRKENEYLRKDLAGLHKILEENMEMKRLYNGMKNDFENVKHMSKKQLEEFKEQSEYKKMIEEIRALRIYKDLYFQLLAEKWLREHPDFKLQTE